MTQIQDLIKKEEQRQKDVINLIASENYPSEAVRGALSSSLVGKYAEGYPGARYYAGNEIADEIESVTRILALKVFGAEDKSYTVNVQAYSGSVANLACYLGALDLGDSILAMSLSHGGHLTHGHNVSLTGKLFNFKHYGVGSDGCLDYDTIRQQTNDLKPKLIVCGATAYSRAINFAKFKEIADSCGAMLMADISHVSGLIAGGVYNSPFGFADIVMTTTHKTLRGPRGALIFTKSNLKRGDKNISDMIDKAIFPGLQGGPHLNNIAGIGVALEEALSDDFRQYVKQIILNSRSFSSELNNLGFKIITGGTDSHMVLIDILHRGYSGLEAQNLLESNQIIINKNSIPFDSRKPQDPSGIRLGVQSETTRGKKEADFIDIARKIAQILPQRIRG